MRAIKLTARIDQNHRLEIQLPDTVPEGNAEIIVLIPSEVPLEASRRNHLKDLFERLARANRPGRSAAEINSQLAVERKSWTQ